MEPVIELPGGGGQATVVDGRWVLEAEHDHVVALSTSIRQRSGSDTLRWVVSDPTEADATAAAGARLANQRDVLQLRRPLPVEPDVVSRYPTVEVRPLRPGTEDEAAWVACNNRSFADHPDQSGFTLDRLHRLMAEPWFDARGLLLHGTGLELAGFCWTKVHDTDPPLGEIFAIGVDPSASGRGFGGALTLAGLHWLSGEGVRTAMLYVDGANAAARHLYAKLGFTLHHFDRIYESGSPPVL